MDATLRKKQRAQIAAWLAGLQESDQSIARNAARAALAPQKRKPDRYDSPAPKPKDESLDLVDEDGNDPPPDEAA